MNRISQITLLCCFATAIASAQFNPPGITKASLSYHQFRMEETSPQFGLKKVKSLVDKLQRTDVPNSDNSTAALTKKAYDSLSTSAKFTYCLIHGEDFSQNCDGMPAFLNEEQKLFSHPIEPGGGEEALSKRQTQFLHSHRTAVIKLARQTMETTGTIGCNLKGVILELDAYELIPDMVKMYQKTSKDGDILSTLFILMKDGKYAPFLKSATYRKLYGPDSSYQSNVDYNKPNADLTIQRAMAFYKSKVH